MKNLLGYTDRLTVRPGERISFRLSCKKEASISLQLVRLINGDVHSSEARFREEEIEATLNGGYPAKHQPVHPGSCIFVPGEAFESTTPDLSIALRCQPHRPYQRKEVLISRYDTATNSGWSLYLDESGHFGLEARDKDGNLDVIESSLGVRKEHWYQVVFSFCGESRDASLFCYELSARGPFDHKHSESVFSNFSKDNLPGVDSPLIIGAISAGEDAADNTIPASVFNGRIENPAFVAAPFSTSDASLLAEGEVPEIDPANWLARWDFSLEQKSRRVIDTSTMQHHGYLHNLPARAVRGSHWTGSESRWTQAPDQYAAIHFHEEDLYDCHWQDDVTWELPESLKSGIYALRLNQGDSEEYVPFFVAAPRGQPTAGLAFMVPTYTYLAYGNNNIFGVIREKMGVSREMSHEFMQSPGTAAYDDLISENRVLGLSTYDTHGDGSGCHFSSWLRPLLNMRPKTILWTFCADLLFIDWLESQGIAYDIITDDLTDEEGLELLQQYRVIMTGNHPEYPTTRMMDAIEAYMTSGGRFMYMGGNGFYWRSASSPHFPGAIEVRRGRTGTRPWASAVGEEYHQFSGEKGGQWRELDRPPQQMFGVGFIAQGYGPSYFRVMEDARSGRASFVLESVDAEVIGDFGLFGGAAGEEIDQANPDYGTPEHAIVVARSENHGPGMMYVIDEMTATQPLELYAPMTYADVVFFETEGGGAVFSTGSMTWCGSLAHNECDNDISRITRNVIDRFLDPAHFSAPRHVDPH